MRHLLLFAAAVIFAYLAARTLAAEAPQAWLLSAAIVGVLGALIDRGWLAIPFLIAGLVAGVLIELHLRLGSGAQATDELADNGPLYVSALGLVVVTYATSLLLLAVLRRRG